MVVVGQDVEIQQDAVERRERLILAAAVVVAVVPEVEPMEVLA